MLSNPKSSAEYKSIYNTPLTEKKVNVGEKTNVSKFS
jgi:hypothetical protein